MNFTKVEPNPNGFEFVPTLTTTKVLDSSFCEKDTNNILEINVSTFAKKIGLSHKNDKC